MIKGWHAVAAVVAVALLLPIGVRAAAITVSYIADPRSGNKAGVESGRLKVETQEDHLWQETGIVGMESGDNSGQFRFDVPAGRRYTIEYINAHSFGSLNATHPTYMQIDVMFEGDVFNAALPLEFIEDTDFPRTGTSEEVTIIADPGSKVSVSVVRPSADSGSTTVVLLSGHYEKV